MAPTLMNVDVRVTDMSTTQIATEIVWQKRTEQEGLHKRRLVELSFLVISIRFAPTY